MASISWDVDASDGGKSLSSPRPDPANRFFAYAPDSDIVLDVAQALGDGVEHAFIHRDGDYFAHLELHHLRASQLGDTLELQQWLLARKVVTVTADDEDEHTYATCYLKPGTRPEIRNENDQRGHFSFIVDLRSAEPLLIDYSA